jgi:NTP pyrophosphatase (non-canonical NTP hydrolase)
MTTIAFQDLRDKLRDFSMARDWDQFHTPKNLATALAVEAAELLEHFQWLRDEESRSLQPETREAVSLEAADVLLYLIRFADKLDLDLIALAHRKIEINSARYPVALARGNAKKYTDL